MIASLQVLRGIAFLCIYAWHCGYGKFAGIAVCFFFVLSGFLLTYRDNENNVENVVKSWALRTNYTFAIVKVKKQYPLFIAMTIASFPKELLKLNFTNGWLTALLTRFLCNLLLIQSWVPNSAVYYSFDGVSWFLSSIAFCYFMYPIIREHLRRAKKSIVLMEIAILYIASAVCYCVIEKECDSELFSWATYVLPTYRLLDFWIGCALGYIFFILKRSEDGICNSNIKRILIYTLGELLVLFICGITALNTTRGFMYIPAVATTILIFAMEKGWVSSALVKFKVLTKLGNYSGDLFLIHLVIIRYIQNIPQIIFNNVMPKCAVLFIALPVSILTMKIYRYFYSKMLE